MAGKLAPVLSRIAHGYFAVMLPLTLTLFLGSFSPIAAGEGIDAKFPNRGQPNPSGLHVELDSRWVESSGYRPVRIKIRPSKKATFTTDRQLTIRIEPYTRYAFPLVAATRTVELPKGRKVAEVTVPLPNFGTINTLHIRIRENGELLKDLSTSLGVPRGQLRGRSTESSPSILVIDSKVPARADRSGTTNQANQPLWQTLNLPDVRQLASAHGHPNTVQNIRTRFSNPSPRSGKKPTSMAVLQLTDTLPNLELLPLNEVPDEPVSFSCVDLTVISWDDLSTLKKDHPQRFEALQSWVSGGATLCVHGVPYDQLPQLERTLGLAPITPNKKQTTNRYSHWRQPRLDMRRFLLGKESNYPTTQGNIRNEIAFARQQAVNRQRVKPAAANKPPANKPPASTTPAKKTQSTSGPDPSFVMRDHHLGTVVAFDANPFEEMPVQPWPWLFDALPENSWKWFKRQGLSMNRPNSEYWNFLIPGVGLPPVNSFLILITLFAIALGPVNFLMLRRVKRMYLLLVTVPLGAFMVTAALLGYALVTDGMGVRVRSRTLTYLDQRSGRSVFVSRQSYYASLVPSSGLRFSDRATVYPLYRDPSEASSARQRPRMEIRWQDGEQHATDYLRSRIPAQFLVSQAGPTELALLVDSEVQADGSLRVRNRLGRYLEAACVSDADGNLFWGESLEPDQVTSLQPVNKKLANDRITAFVTRHPPTLPEGFSTSYYRSFAVASQNRYRSSSDDYREMQPSLLTGILHRGMSMAYVSPTDGMPPRQYVAFTDGSDVPLGVESAEIEDSLHVLIGRW